MQKEIGMFLCYLFLFGLTLSGQDSLQKNPLNSQEPSLRILKKALNKEKTENNKQIKKLDDILNGIKKILSESKNSSTTDLEQLMYEWESLNSSIDKNTKTIEELANSTNEITPKIDRNYQEIKDTNDGLVEILKSIEANIFSKIDTLALSLDQRFTKISVEQIDAKLTELHELTRTPWSFGILGGNSYTGFWTSIEVGFRKTPDSNFAFGVGLVTDLDHGMFIQLNSKIYPYPIANKAVPYLRIDYNRRFRLFYEGDYYNHITQAALGYELPIKNKFRLDAQIGGSYNISENYSDVLLVYRLGFSFNIMKR